MVRSCSAKLKVTSAIIRPVHSEPVEEYERQKLGVDENFYPL